MVRGLYNEGTIWCGDYKVRRLSDKKGLHGEETIWCVDYMVRRLSD